MVIIDISDAEVELRPESIPDTDALKSLMVNNLVKIDVLGQGLKCQAVTQVRYVMSRETLINQLPVALATGNAGQR
jgi:hypothetical protein